jgi:hypothetical protein
MKYNRILILVFCFFCIIGCKDKSTDNSELSTEQQKTMMPFKVTLKFVAKNNDDFCLLYTEDGTINFGEKGIWKSIEGSENEQSVQFEFPEEIFPTSLRIDLGMKPEQSDIILKSIILEYKDKKREITGTEIAAFFRPDENTCMFDATTGIVKPIVKDGVRKNPSLYPQSILRQEIEKLAQ